MRIQVVASDPGWPAKFEQESRQIARALGELVVAVHHIDSTAIPGIVAKPIIDILLEAPDVRRLDSLAAGMTTLGYECLGEYGISGRRYFRRNDPSGTRTHQVHAFQCGDPHIQRHLAFRDYLIAHPDVARAYDDLKRELATRHADDAEAYMDGKDPFIKAHEAGAIAWARRL